MVKRKRRFEEFTVNFQELNKNDPEDIDLDGFFSYCLITKNKKTGFEIKSYFDDKQTLPTLLDNIERSPRKNDIGIRMKIFNKDGKLASEWKKVGDKY